MSMSYVTRWVLMPTGQLEATFRNHPEMKIITSTVASVDAMNVVTTDSGCAYVIGEPLFKEEWPSNIPAKAINQTFFYSIQQHRNNIRGDTLWEIFEDELATLFATFGSR